MSKKNEECPLKYCPNCHVRLHRGNCREERDYVVITRSCPKKCGYSVHVVEVELEAYNENVEKLNTIKELLES